MFEHSRLFVLLEDKIQNRSRIPVVGHPSSSDVIAPSNSTYNSTNVPIFKRLKLRLGKCDMTLLEVISSSEAHIQLLKQHSVFSRTLLKESHIQKSDITTKNLLC